MAIKNYLVSSIFNVKTTKWAWTDRANEGDIRMYYHKMYDISVASFEHFLEGDFTVICWAGSVENPTHIARRNWDLIRDLWSSHECNILWHGPDTQMIQPTEIFGRYQDFELFSWTDPKSIADVENYFNNDIRYFPSTMSQDVWAVGDKLVETWDTSNTDQGWNYEQIMHNKMFWSQPGRTLENSLRPDMVYQAQWLPSADDAVKARQDDWNGGVLEDAHIIHWHGSRSAQAKLSAMQQFAQVTGVEV